MEEERLYDVYALDEDIKILEKYTEKNIPCDSCRYCGEKPNVTKAMRNLLEAYRKVKEENDRVDYTSVYLNGVYDGEDKWKSKIKEKIEEDKKTEKKELKGLKGQDRYFVKQIYQYRKVALQELLEEE